jgi:hypothetical protein
VAATRINRRNILQQYVAWTPFMSEYTLGNYFTLRCIKGTVPPGFQLLDPFYCSLGTTFLGPTMDNCWHKFIKVIKFFKFIKLTLYSILLFIYFRVEIPRILRILRIQSQSSVASLHRKQKDNFTEDCVFRLNIP